ncbi:MAG TPA: ATP-binding protein, partial [Planctomycetota bacterium]
DRLAAMGTLAAGLAHEINSPLAGALQGLETLRREATSDKAMRHGELTQDALERIGMLVRRLLQLAPARVEAGRCAVQAVSADLPLFLESRLSRHRLELVMPEAPLLVNAAAGDLFPVLLNLVQNALDALDSLASRRAGRIEVRGEALAGGGACVTVRDDGPGADPALMPHLYEPFVTDKEVGAGTGLGLALAHATVRQLGGTIDVRNRDSGGLEVELRLPAPRGDGSAGSGPA